MSDRIEPLFDSGSDSWRRLAPGVYDDGAGGLHIDVPELLAANGWPDTAENRDQVEAAARKMFGPTLEVHE
jgi:hypothetical protein